MSDSGSVRKICVLTYQEEYRGREGCVSKKGYVGQWKRVYYILEGGTHQTAGGESRGISCSGRVWRSIVLQWKSVSTMEEYFITVEECVYYVEEHCITVEECVYYGGRVCVSQ
jgi:hypothetical protein